MAGLLGLVGVEVVGVEREADGSWSVHAVTAAGVAGCCPDCGASSGRVKELAGQRLAHLVVAPMALVWHKNRFLCENSGCARASFIEGGPVAARGGRVSTPGRETMGRLVGDWLVPVSRVAGAAGVGWPTAHGGFVAVAEAAGIVAGPAEPAQAAGAVGRSVSGPLPLVGVLGVDDHRRGRARYHRDLASGRWVEDADRWQSVLVDSAGCHGLLGQAEGRTAAATAAWIAAQPARWRANIWAVTTDLSTVYKSAVRTALPHALLAVDPFHVVQLANKMIGDVRRRVTFERHGRRGRATDLVYTTRMLLVRNAESLSEAARGRLLCALADLGDGGRQLAAAHKAKELLRDLLALAPTHTGRPTSRSAISNALTRFFTHCATVGATVPEIVTLAETISAWRDEIGNTVHHGLSNATAEGVNRLIKLVYRIAFGLTNVTNQQRRARYTASRRTRPTWPRTVTTGQPHPAIT